MNEDNAGVQIFYDEEYNPAFTEKLFQQFLKDVQENHK
jgi:hypothetical protein